MVKWAHETLAGGQDNTHSHSHTLTHSTPRGAALLPFCFFMNLKWTPEKKKTHGVRDILLFYTVRLLCSEGTEQLPWGDLIGFRKNITVKRFWHLVHPTSVCMVEWLDSPDSIFSWVTGWQAAATWNIYGIRLQLKLAYFSKCVWTEIGSVSTKCV